MFFNQAAALRPLRLDRGCMQAKQACEQRGYMQSVSLSPFLKLKD